MSIYFVRATSEEVVAELEIGPLHHQAYGIVHGGVHSGLVETVASVGAALSALPHGQSVVGLENHTSFLYAVRQGLLRATARPLMRGRRTQVWEVTVANADGRTVASGQVRFLVLEAGTALAAKPCSSSIPPSGRFNRLTFNRLTITLDVSLPLRWGCGPRFQLPCLAHKLDLRAVQLKIGIQERGIALVLCDPSILFFFDTGCAALDFGVRGLNIGLGELMLELRYVSRCRQLLH